jgi:hypothetical protein
MTMFTRGVTVAALGALGLFAWAGAARASEDDLVPLNGGKDTPAVVLGKDVSADTVLTRRGGGGGGRGHVGRGGFRGSVRVGYRGSYARRGYSYGVGRGWDGYRGGYGYRRYYRPWYYGGYYGYPRYYSSYYGYPSYYYSNGYYYSAPYCSPVVGVGSVYTAPAVVPSATMPYAPGAGDYGAPTLPVPTPGRTRLGPVPPDGTYDYDGGPNLPVPLPRAEPAPALVPPGGNPAPVLRPVSAPAPSTSTFRYAAYGEQPQATSPPPGRTYFTGTSKKSR